MGEPFEVGLPGRAGGEQDQHLGGLVGVVAEPVHAARRDVEEVAFAGLDPLVPVEASELRTEATPDTFPVAAMGPHTLC